MSDDRSLPAGDKTREPGLARMKPAWLEKAAKAVAAIKASSPTQGHVAVEDDEESEYWRQRDTQANAATKIPTRESVSLKCIWMFEAYTSVEAEQLATAISSHGWLSDPSRGEGWPSDMLLTARRSPWGGSWANFGWIGHEARFVTRKGPLPAGADAASIQLWGLTPSLTILGVMFRVNPNVSHEIAAALNSEYRTTTEPIGATARHYVEVRDHKRRQTIQIRDRVRTHASQWFDEFFPGVFSAAPSPSLKRDLSRAAAAKHPAAEVWEFDVSEPFETDASTASALPFMEILGFAERWNAWELESDALPKLRLVTDSDDPRLMAFAANKAALLRVPASGLAEATIEGTAYWLGDGQSRIVISILLDHYWTALTSIRDALFARREPSIPKEIERLRSFQSELARLSHAIPRLTAEIVKLAEERWSVPQAGDFRQLEPSPGSTAHAYLFPSLRQRLVHDSQRLREFLVDVSASAGAAGTLVGAQASDRAARTGLRIQWASLGIAVLALVVAGVSLLLTVPRP